LLRLSLLVFGVVLATWLIPSVGTAGTTANVADVVGTPITRQVFEHWMFVTAKSSTSRGQPVIVPTDPPKFTECITRVRETSRHRHDSENTLRDDCGQLFVALRDQVLDFLITAHWLEDRAFTNDIAFTPAQVRRAFDADKREQFQTPADFKTFLTETGQTIEDVIFRVRVTLIYQALLNQEHLTPAALSAEVAHLFKSRTTCARYYAMSRGICDANALSARSWDAAATCGMSGTTLADPRGEPDRPPTVRSAFTSATRKRALPTRSVRCRRRPVACAGGSLLTAMHATTPRRTFAYEPLVAPGAPYRTAGLLQTAQTDPGSRRSRSSFSEDRPCDAKPSKRMLDLDARWLPEPRILHP